jgi:hypothetical protein
MLRARDVVRVALLFALLTIVMTWPQTLHLRSHVASHFDAYFSMWRLGWIAHQLTHAPLALFDGNIFYPQRLTLALSDPILLIGVGAAPLLWVNVPPVLVYNLLVLGSFVLSGVAAWALGTRLTGSPAAGVLAGIVFAFAPYRFEHYFHLEILWGFWIPLALLALHAACERGTVVAGIRTGLIVLAQALSCLYYAVYLGMTLALAAPLLIRWRSADRWRTIAGLAAGAAVALAVTVLYLQPLLAIRPDVIPRELAETGRYSASLINYLSTPTSNRLYGALTESFGDSERRLFPGLVAIVLAIGALIPARRTTLIYLGLLVFAVIASMGVNAPFFRLLRGALDLVSMLRVPARFAAVGLCALSVLVAFGAASLFTSIARPRARAVVFAVLALLMLAEYSTGIALERVRQDRAAVYRWLATQPRGPVAELPMPELLRGMPGRDPEREFFSTSHWQPLINGYSGYYPIAYNRLLIYVSVFPRGGWIDILIGRRAKYLVIHETELTPPDLKTALERLEAHPGVERIGRFPDEEDPAWVYRVREVPQVP